MRNPPSPFTPLTPIPNPKSPTMEAECGNNAENEENVGAHAEDAGKNPRVPGGRQHQPHLWRARKHKCGAVACMKRDGVDARQVWGAAGAHTFGHRPQRAKRRRQLRDEHLPCCGTVGAAASVSTSVPVSPSASVSISTSVSASASSHVCGCAPVCLLASSSSRIPVSTSSVAEALAFVRVRAAVPADIVSATPRQNRTKHLAHECRDSVSVHATRRDGVAAAAALRRCLAASTAAAVMVAMAVVVAVAALAVIAAAAAAAAAAY
eukprot:366027-Chlamydomonas_euryale.AAC.4